MIQPYELAGVSHSQFIALPLAERDRYTELAAKVERLRSKAYRAGYDADAAVGDALWNAVHEARHFLETDRPTEALARLNEV